MLKRVEEAVRGTMKVRLEKENFLFVDAGQKLLTQSYGKMQISAVFLFSYFGKGRLHYIRPFGRSVS